MSIIRTKSPHRFTIVSNELLAESNPMSWEATGLLIYLLSKPDNWQVSIAALTNIGKCGKNKIESILKELKRLGYVVGKRRSSGKYNYYVYDTPQTPQANPKPENQVQAKKPKPENPVQAFPEQDFQSLINTDIKINTENNNNNSETISSKHHAVNAHELLLSLNFGETAPTPNKALSGEQKERQKEEVVLLPLSGLNERQAKEASKKLAQLSPDQREIAIQSFNQTAERGRIKRPMALIHELVNLGLENKLEPPLSAFNQNPTLTPTQELKTHSEANNEARNEDSRRETILEILKLKVAKYKDKMLAEFQRNRAVFIQGLGVFYKDDLAAAGLFD